MIEDAEEETKEVLGDDYVHFIDAIPEIKQFLQEIKEKELLSGVVSKPEDQVVL